MSYFHSGYSSGSAGGSLYINNTRRYACVYMQRAPVARFALDGDWKRSSPDRCSGSGTYGWSDSFRLAYDGFKFRLCRNVAYRPDTCGSSTTIYR